ncbi:hypothetical protein [Castellaniella sp. UC4442_H9]
MELNLDSHIIEIPCEACGHKLRESIGRLKHDPEITCPSCGVVTKIEASGLRKGVAEAQKGMADLQRSIKKLFK